MKTRILLLTTLLFSAPAQALPRLQHLLHGKIVGVDPAARSFTIESTTSGRVIVLTWDDTTKLRDGKTPATAAALASGRPVKLYYRADVGVNIARDVALQPATPPETRAAP